jgi:hypothetical protein
VLQQDLEVELLGDPHRRHQVVGPVAVEVDRPLLLQHLDERFETHVALDLLADVLLRLVLAGLDELLPLQGGDLHPGERGLLLVLPVAFRVLAVGHLEAAQDLGPVRQPAGDPHLLDGAAAELHVERLPPDDVPRPGHDVRGGDAAGHGHADAGVVREDRVDGPDAGLHRPAHLVAVGVGRHARPRVDADVRVRVHQPGDDDGPLEVTDLGPDGGRSRPGAADRHDLAFPHDQRSTDHRPVVLTGVDGRVAEHDRTGFARPAVLQGIHGVRPLRPDQTRHSGQDGANHESAPTGAEGTRHDVLMGAQSAERITKVAVSNPTCQRYHPG